MLLCIDLEFDCTTALSVIAVPGCRRQLPMYGAHPLTDAELPESVQRLAALHALAITGDDLPTDIDNLLDSIERGRRRTAESDSDSAAATPHQG
jgi:hypothetical protein